MQKEHDLRQYISDKEYVSVVRKIVSGENFLPPRKRYISKQGNDRKRAVYIYSREENYVLKLLTYLLIRKYDSIFSPNLYSFREKHGVRRAVGYLRHFRDLQYMYAYKADIHDYFNSVDVSLLIPMLETVMADEPETLRFVVSLLADSRVSLQDGSIVSEKKGIMAGVPVSSFLANVYLRDMDRHFFMDGNRYARYSDDILVFSRDEAGCLAAKETVRDFLGQHHLTINEKKEKMSAPHENGNSSEYPIRTKSLMCPVSRRKSSSRR